MKKIIYACFVVAFTMLCLPCMGANEDQFAYPLGPIGGSSRARSGTNHLRVTSLIAGAPGAKSGLKVDDVIIGAFGQNFGVADGGSHSGPTQALGLAIEYAEEECNGVLELTVIRSGVGETQIKVQLPPKPRSSPAFPLNSPKFDEVWNLASEELINRAQTLTSNSYAEGYIGVAAVTHPYAFDPNVGGGKYYKASQQAKNKVINYVKSLKPYLYEPKAPDGTASTLTANDPNLKGLGDGSTWEMGQAGMVLSAYYMRCTDEKERAELKLVMTDLAKKMAAHIQRWKQPPTSPNSTYKPCLEGIMSHGGLEGDYIHLGWGGGINICSSHTLVGMAALRASGGANFNALAPDAHDKAPSYHPITKTKASDDKNYVSVSTRTIDQKFTMGWNWATNPQNGTLALNSKYSGTDGHVCYTSQGGSDYDAAGRTAGFATVGNICAYADGKFNARNYGINMFTEPTASTPNFETRIDRMTHYVSRRWATQMNCHAYCFPGTFYSQTTLPFMNSKLQRYWLENWQFYYNMCRQPNGNGGESLIWFPGRAHDEAYVNARTCTLINITALKPLAQGYYSFIPGFKKERLLMKYRYPFVTWPTLEARKVTIKSPEQVFKIDVSDGVGNLLTGRDYRASWNVVSGPADVMFTHPLSANTSVTFTANGTYRLRLLLERPNYEPWEDFIDVTVDYFSLPEGLTKGTISGARYTGLSGNSLTTLTSAAKYPNFPDVTFTANSLSIPSNGDNYGGRISGYIVPTMSDSYVFYIAVDDAGEFYLNKTGMENDQLQLMCSATAATGNGVFTKVSSQKSDTVYLEGGKVYYFESIWKEGTGADYLQIAWTSSRITSPTIIPSENIASMDESDPALRIVKQPIDVISSIGGVARFNLEVAGDGPFIYQWRLDGKNVGSQSLTSTYTINNVSNSSVGNYDCVVTTPNGTLTSTLARLSLDGESSIKNGGLWIEHYYYVSGANVASLTSNSKFPLYPDASDSISKLGISPMNVTNAGVRLSGWIKFPSAGQWRLGSRQDDQAQLFLSINEEPDYKKMIVNNTSYTAMGWSSYITITDTEQLYYIEYIFKYNGSSDHFGLYWQNSADAVPTITKGGSNIPSSALYYVDGGCGTLPNSQLNPVIYADTMVVAGRAPTQYNVMKNILAYDVNLVDVVSVSKALYGSVSVGADGKSVIYTPGEYRPSTGDAFTYTVRNNYGKTTEGKMYVTFKDFPMNYVRYFPMDEKTGSTLYDRSNTQRDATISAIDVSQTHVAGRAFGGFEVSDTLKSSLDLGANWIPNAMTLSLWVKTTQQSPSNLFNEMPALLGNGSSETSAHKIFALNEEGQMGILIGSQSLFSQKIVNDGAWHHVVIRRSAITSGTSRTLSIFVDGVLESTGSFSDPNTNHALFSQYLGKTMNVNSETSETDSLFFNGVCDEFKVFDTLLTEQDIVALYSQIPETEQLTPMVTLTSNLTQSYLYASAPSITFNASAATYGGELTALALYQGDVKLGDIASDGSYTWSSIPAGEYTVTARGVIDGTTYSSSPISFRRLEEKLAYTLPYRHYKLDETVRNSPIDAVHNVASTTPISHDSILINQEGYIDRAYLLNGTHTGIKVPGFAENSNRITLSAWIKRDGVQTNFSGIIFQRNGSVNGLQISGSTLRYHWNDGGYGDNVGLSVPDSRWTFVAMTVLPNKASFYMRPLNEDGSLGTLQSKTFTKNYNLPRIVGEWNIGYDNTDRRFKGLIDEVRMYDFALTEDEIRYLSDISSPYNKINFTLAEETTPSESGTYTVTASLAKPALTPLSIPVTFGGTSIKDGPNGYTVNTESFTFAQNSTTASIEITIQEDNVREENEYITMRFGSLAENIILGLQDNYRMNITDDDKAVIRIEASTPQIEAVTPDAVRNYTFNVNASYAPNEVLQIPYRIYGTATLNKDYVVLSENVLSFPADATTFPLNISIPIDSTFKPTLTLVAELGVPYFERASLDDNAKSAEVSILCNHTKPIAQFETSDEIHLTEGATPTSYKILLSRPSHEKIVLNIQSSGSAVNGADYGLSASQLIFEPGEIEKIVKLNIIQDMVFEGTENAVLTLVPVNEQSVGIGGSPLLITLFDDENAPTIGLTQTTQSINRGNQVSINAKLSQKLDQDVVLALNFSGTARSGIDYQLNTTPQITIPAGALSSAYIFTTLQGDATSSENEQISVSVIPNSLTILLPDFAQQTITLSPPNVIPAPLLAYSFTELVSDSKYVDESGNGRDLIFDTLPEGVSVDSVGYHGKSVFFSDSNNALKGNTFTNVLPATNNATICAWVKWHPESGAQNYMTVAQLSSTTHNQVGEIKIGSNWKVGYKWGNAQEVSTAAFYKNRWSFIAITVSPTGETLRYCYTVGESTPESYATAKYSSMASLAFDTISIGADKNNGNRFYGWVDDVKVYDQALSVNQLRQLCLSKVGIIASRSVIELNNNAESLDLSLSELPDTPIHLTLQTESSDYNVTPTSLSFTRENWATKQTVQVSATHDDLGAPDASLNISGNNVSPISIYLKRDKSTLPSLSFVTTSYEKKEDDGAFVVTLSLNQALTEDVRVPLYVTGTAQRNMAYSFNHDEAVFAAGTTTCQLTFTPINRPGLFTGDFQVSIAAMPTSVLNMNIQPICNITVKDNDVQSKLGFKGNYTELDISETTCKISLVASHPSNAVLQANYHVYRNGVLDPFTYAPVELASLANETTLSIPVKSRDEKIQLKLYNVSNGEIWASKDTHLISIQGSYDVSNPVASVVVNPIWNGAPLSTVKFMDYPRSFVIAPNGQDDFSVGFAWKSPSTIPKNGQWYPYYVSSNWYSEELKYTQVFTVRANPPVLRSVAGSLMSWKPPRPIEGFPVAGYKIYKSVGKTGPKTCVATLMDPTLVSYDIGEQTDIYCWWITAIGTAEGYGESLFSVSKTNKAINSARSLTASQGNVAGKVTVGWTVDKSMPYYQLLRSESPAMTSPTTIMPWAKTKSFSDINAEPAKVYYYQLYCAEGLAGEKAETYVPFVVSGWTKLEAPTITSVSGGSKIDLPILGKVQLSWTPSLKNNLPQAQYVVARSLKTVKDAEIIAYTDATSYIDETGVPGVEYFYFVSTAAEISDSTAVVPTVWSKGKKGYAKLDEIDLAYAQDGESHIRIRVYWNKVEGAHYYRLYREEESDSTTRVLLTKKPIEHTLYEDLLKLDVKKKYRYYVQAYADKASKRGGELSSIFATGALKLDEIANIDIAASVAAPAIHVDSLAFDEEAKFIKMPVSYGMYLDGTRMKKMMFTSYQNTQNSLSVWNKNDVMLFNKKEYTTYLKTNFTYYYLQENKQLDSKMIEVWLTSKDRKNVAIPFFGATVRVFADFYYRAPTLDQTTLAFKVDANVDQLMTITGSYLGSKNPTAWIEYRDPVKNTIKKVSLKVSPVLDATPDALTKSKITNATTATGQFNITIPKKWAIAPPWGTQTELFFVMSTGKAMVSVPVEVIVP